MGLSTPSGESLSCESLETLKPASVSWSPLGPGVPSARFTVTADSPSDDIRLNFLGL